MSDLKLYHGTVARFRVIDLNHAHDYKDFGCGFYMTTDIRQATAWAVRARNSALQNGNPAVALVYSIKLDRSLLKNLRVHNFVEVSIPWLDFVLYNRCRGKSEAAAKILKQGSEYADYDLVIGKIADSRTQFYVDRFISKEVFDVNSKTEFIKKLEPNVFSDQYCFKTCKAVELLNMYGNMMVKEVR